jgi:hypothetical protein
MVVVESNIISTLPGCALAMPGSEMAQMIHTKRVNHRFNSKLMKIPPGLVLKK